MTKTANPFRHSHGQGTRTAGAPGQADARRSSVQVLPAGSAPSAAKNVTPVTDQEASTSASPTEPQRTWTIKKVGFIGTDLATKTEKRQLHFIGRCIARLGHSIITTNTAGSVSALREGVLVEGGDALDVEAGVIDQSDHTLVFADERLLSRLHERYPDLHERSDVVIIEKHQLLEWVDAMSSLLIERGIAEPDY